MEGIIGKTYQSKYYMIRTRRIEMKTANNNLVKVIVSFLIVIFIVGICFAMGLPFSLGRAFAESKQGEIEYVAHTYQASIGGYYVVQIIDSVQELHDMDDANKGVLFGEDAMYHVGNLSQDILKYDDAFFENKEIIYVTVNIPQLEARTLNGVEIVDGELVVTIEKPHYSDEAMFCQVITNYIFVIEIDRSIGKSNLRVEVVETK